MQAILIEMFLLPISGEIVPSLVTVHLEKEKPESLKRRVTVSHSNHVTFSNVEHRPLFVAVRLKFE